MPIGFRDSQAAKARLERAANRLGLTPSQVLRTLAHDFIRFSERQEVVAE